MEPKSTATLADFVSVIDLLGRHGAVPDAHVLDLLGRAHDMTGAERHEKLMELISLAVHGRRP